MCCLFVDPGHPLYATNETSIMFYNSLSIALHDVTSIFSKSISQQAAIIISLHLRSKAFKKLDKYLDGKVKFVSDIVACALVDRNEMNESMSPTGS